MLSSPFFRFLLPTQNPLGFGAVDFVALGLAVLLVAVFLTREAALSMAQRFAGRTVPCMTLLAALPIILRLALLPHHPVPVARVADDFSYRLLGDTLAHFRFANPMHPMHRFFEGVFTIQDPTWSSIYPLGQGLVLAFGQLVFRQPWVGVALSVGTLCALCYWMLRAWVSPPWALLGGLLAAIEFGPLSSWMNTYWGGAVSGIAGCLVFGALPRLRNNARTRDAVLLGIGLGLELLTRPFEFVLLAAIVILFFGGSTRFSHFSRSSVGPGLRPCRWPSGRRFDLSRATPDGSPAAARKRRPHKSYVVIAALVLLPFFGLMLLQNKQVTGSWTTLPYQLSRYQYGIPATFTFQANPIPHRPLTVEQQIDYDAQIDVHGKTTDTVGSYLARLGGRVRFYRFFFLAPLYLALPWFLPALRQYRFAWIAIALGLLWLGDAFYPYFYPHYIAAATCVFLLVSVISLEKLSRWNRDAATLILGVCLAHFVFWYGVHLNGNPNLLLALSPEESWDSIDNYTAGYSDLTRRIAVNHRLAAEEGRQLVFVRYYPQRTAREWIQNAADIDQSRVVWALDLGPDEDAILRRYYPDRHAWLLEPDAVPPKLTPLL